MSTKTVDGPHGTRTSVSSQRSWPAPPGGPPGERRYQLLAEMLVSLIIRMLPAPGRSAAEAGRQWGGNLARHLPPCECPETGEAIARLTALMEELGFACTAVADGGQYRICLHRCPFREMAQHHQDVVCSLHLGLMEGALAQMQAPVTMDHLEPFTEPGLCIAYLTAPGRYSRQTSGEPAGS